MHVEQMCCELKPVYYTSRIHCPLLDLFIMLICCLPLHRLSSYYSNGSSLGSTCTYLSTNGKNTHCGAGRLDLCFASVSWNAFTVCNPINLDVS